MADGRIICIGGEHEDGYDPDFCIFNDVVVLFPADGKDDVDLESGRVEIYGYPESIFPPTDFHSATIVEDQIYIIGSLGYGDDRDDDSCQLYVLDSNNYRINSLEHSGPHPGWISRHHASYDPAAHAITVRGGKRIVADDYRANHCIHRLHLEVMRWEQVAEFERHYFYQFGTVAEAWVRSIQDFCPPASAKMLWTDMPEVFVKSFDMMDIRCTLKNLCGSVRLVIEGDPGDEARADLIASVQDFLAAESGAEWYANEVASFD
ncbi:MAG: hypothetical protein D6692_06905 [Planctomycetota bacterium]|nr:MAG: hypothetical protein D6692_06905 [Planctomycetota bacterium]